MKMLPIERKQEWGLSLPSLLIAVAIFCFIALISYQEIFKVIGLLNYLEKGSQKYTLYNDILSRIDCTATDLANQTCDGTTKINVMGKIGGSLATLIHTNRSTDTKYWEIEAFCDTSLIVKVKEKPNRTLNPPVINHNWQNLVLPQEGICKTNNNVTVENGFQVVRGTYVDVSSTIDTPENTCKKWISDMSKPFATYDPEPAYDHHLRVVMTCPNDSTLISGGGGAGLFWDDGYNKFHTPDGAPDPAGSSSLSALYYVGNTLTIDRCTATYNGQTHYAEGNGFIFCHPRSLEGIMK